MPHTSALVALLAILASLLAGCETTPPPAPAPDQGSQSAEPAAAGEAATPDEIPAVEPAAVRDLTLVPGDLGEVQFVPGLELGTDEPESDIESRYQDGMSLFAYPVPRLGGQPGRELLVVMMNVRSRERITLPSGRARVAYVSEDPDLPRRSAEAGFIEIDHAGQDGLWGGFEVRFDELDHAIVRGRFDSRVLPTTAPE